MSTIEVLFPGGIPLNEAMAYVVSRLHERSLHSDLRVRKSRGGVTVVSMEYPGRYGGEISETMRLIQNGPKSVDVVVFR